MQSTPDTDRHSTRNWDQFKEGPQSCIPFTLVTIRASGVWGHKCSIHQATSKLSVSYTAWRVLMALIVTVHTVGFSSKKDHSPTLPLRSQLRLQVSEGTSVPYIRQHLNSLFPTLHGEHFGYWSSQYTQLGSVQRRSRQPYMSFRLVIVRASGVWGHECSIHQVTYK